MHAGSLILKSVNKDHVLLLKPIDFVSKCVSLNSERVREVLTPTPAVLCRQLVFELSSHFLELGLLALKRSWSNRKEDTSNKSDDTVKWQ
jgi:hypothetical protein